ncbi:hypothetical protein ORI99_00145 [Alishewanella sp. SMS9]|nr:hypothetical protein [Alishewanella sp. SMS9]
MKKLIAVASYWLLRKDFSGMDVFYASIAALTANDYGFWSAEFFIATMVILSFHYLFCLLTSRIRFNYQIKRTLKMLADLDKKNVN